MCVCVDGFIVEWSAAEPIRNLGINAAGQASDHRNKISTEKDNKASSRTAVRQVLISAFVLSRIDYCNYLLAGCPKQLIHKLQKVQNNAASLICRTPKSDHISPVLNTLHWLPVEQRIEYKLLLLACKSVNNDGTSYLSDLLKFYIPSRQLRSSSDSRLLCILSFRLKSLGQRKFSYQASVLWNSLPISLRHSNSTLAFKSALKTHLFPSQ